MKPLLLAPFLLTGSLFAEELIVKTSSRTEHETTKITLLPTDPSEIKIEAKQWSAFKITEIVEHGTKVKKGETLVSFDREDYLLKLEEEKESAKGRKIALEKLERELADLKTTTTHTLEGLKLAHDRAKEALDYFTTTGRALQIDDAKENLKRAERSLSYQEEELKQLLKMYEEDGITEETEEIILKRQKASVESAKFSLIKAKESTQWEIEKSIPRQAVDLRRAYEQAKLAYETGQLNLPRTFSEKELAVAKSKRANIAADKDLAELEADEQFFGIKAPEDGVVYYGTIKDGSWSVGETSKFLFKDGSVPVGKTFMVLVPDKTPLSAYGQLTQGQFLAVPADATGSLMIDGSKEARYPVKIRKMANVPNGGNTYGLSMEVTLPEDHRLATGMTGEVKLITFQKEDAIVIPKKFIKTSEGKSTVKLKMADGKMEDRLIKTGRTFDNNTAVEVIEGLEVDQVILDQ